MKLIVGLGNPGEKYEKTRHNIGFMIIDHLAEKLEITNFREKFQGLIGETILNGEKVILLKPQTYMNLSGNSIKEVVSFYKMDIEEDVVVVFDDMDLKLGQIKIKQKGGAGGHNGLKSIISHFGENFIRIKCGIGKPESREEVVNYVLGNFSKSNQEIINELIETSSKAAKSICTAKSIERVIEKVNRKK